MNYQFQYLTAKSVVTQLVNTSKYFEYLTPYIKCVTNQTFY